VCEHDHLPVASEFGQPVGYATASNMIQGCDRVIQHKRRLAVVEVRFGEVAGEPERSLLALAQHLFDWLGRLRSEQRRTMPVLALLAAGALEFDPLEPQPVRFPRKPIADQRGHMLLRQFCRLPGDLTGVREVLGNLDLGAAARREISATIAARAARSVSRDWRSFLLRVTSTKRPVKSIGRMLDDAALRLSC
jgi:hypothetical protein